MRQISFFALMIAGALSACSPPQTNVKPLADGVWRDTTMFDSRSCGKDRAVVVHNGLGHTIVLMAYPPWGWGTGRFYLSDVRPGETDTLFELQPDFTVGADHGALPERRLQFGCVTPAE